MGYNRQQLKMKKVFLTMTLIAGIAAGAMTLSAFSKSEPSNGSNTIEATEETAGDCSFEVTDVDPSISGTTVTLKVNVRPAFTPEGTGSYRVVVKPNGNLRNILDSQSQSVIFYYSSSKWNTESKQKTVTFHCDVHDNTYNQCRAQSFSTSCYKE